jgi:hypothetical protein
MIRICIRNISSQVNKLTVEQHLKNNYHWHLNAILYTCFFVCAVRCEMNDIDGPVTVVSEVEPVVGIVNLEPNFALDVVQEVSHVIGAVNVKLLFVLSHAYTSKHQYSQSLILKRFRVKAKLLLAFVHFEGFKPEGRIYVFFTKWTSLKNEHG